MGAVAVVLRGDRGLKLIDSLIILGFDENDLWIAAIAYQHNLIVVSADSDFQRIQQVKTLSVDSWV